MRPSIPPSGGIRPQAWAPPHQQFPPQQSMDQQGMYGGRMPGPPGPGGWQQPVPQGGWNQGGQQMGGPGYQQPNYGGPGYQGGPMGGMGGPVPMGPMGGGPAGPMGGGPMGPMGGGQMGPMVGGPMGPMGGGPSGPMNGGPMSGGPMGGGPTGSMGSGPTGPMGGGPQAPMGAGSAPSAMGGGSGPTSTGGGDNSPMVANKSGGMSGDGVGAAVKDATQAKVDQLAADAKNAQAGQGGKSLSNALLELLTKRKIQGGGDAPAAAIGLTPPQTSNSPAAVPRSRAEEPPQQQAPQNTTPNEPQRWQSQQNQPYQQQQQQQPPQSQGFNNQQQQQFPGGYDYNSGSGQQQQQQFNYGAQSENNTQGGAYNQQGQDPRQASRPINPPFVPQQQPEQPKLKPYQPGETPSLKPYQPPTQYTQQNRDNAGNTPASVPYSQQGSASIMSYRQEQQQPMKVIDYEFQHASEQQPIISKADEKMHNLNYVLGAIGVDQDMSSKLTDITRQHLERSQALLQQQYFDKGPQDDLASLQSRLPKMESQAPPPQQQQQQEQPNQANDMVSALMQYMQMLPPGSQEFQMAQMMTGVLTTLPPEAQQAMMANPMFTQLLQNMSQMGQKPPDREMHRFSENEYKEMLIDRALKKERIGLYRNELEMLIRQRTDLSKRVKKGQRGSDQNPLLTANQQLQDDMNQAIGELQAQIKMIEKYLGSRVTQSVTKEEVDSARRMKKDDRARATTKCRDQGEHWCQSCNIVCGTLDEYSKHLISDSHFTLMDVNYLPWERMFPKPQLDEEEAEEVKKEKKAKKEKKDGSDSDDSDSDEKEDKNEVFVDIKGIEFIIPVVRTFYCKLCRLVVTREENFLAHVKCREHQENFLNFVEEKPFYERHLELDKAIGYLEKTGFLRLPPPQKQQDDHKEKLKISLKKEKDTKKETDQSKQKTASPTEKPAPKPVEPPARKTGERKKRASPPKQYRSRSRSPPAKARYGRWASPPNRSPGRRRSRSPGRRRSPERRMRRSRSRSRSPRRDSSGRPSSGGADQKKPVFTFGGGKNKPLTVTINNSTPNRAPSGPYSGNPSNSAKPLDIFADEEDGGGKAPLCIDDPDKQEPPWRAQLSRQAPDRRLPGRPHASTGFGKFNVPRGHGQGQKDSFASEVNLADFEVLDEVNN